MVNIIEYQYSGSVTVCCERCDTCHDVKFEGVSDSSIEDAITEALEDAGWAEGVCPQCVEDDCGPEYIEGDADLDD